MYPYHLLLILFFITSHAMPCVREQAEDQHCETSCDTPQSERACSYYGRTSYSQGDMCPDGTPSDMCRNVQGWDEDGNPIEDYKWVNANTECDGSTAGGGSSTYKLFTEDDIKATGGKGKVRILRALKYPCEIQLDKGGTSDCYVYNRRTTVIVKVPETRDRRYIYQAMSGSTGNKHVQGRVVRCAQTMSVAELKRYLNELLTEDAGSATHATASTGRDRMFSRHAKKGTPQLQITGSALSAVEEEPHPIVSATATNPQRKTKKSATGSTSAIGGSLATSPVAGTITRSERIFSRHTPGTGGTTSLLAVAPRGRGRQNTVAVPHVTGGAKKARIEYKTNRLYEDYYQQSAAREEEEDEWRYNEAVINVDIALKQLKLAKVMRKHHKKMRGYY